MGTATKETAAAAVKKTAKKTAARSKRAVVPAVEDLAGEGSAPVAGSLLGDLPAGARLVPVDQLLPHPSNPRRDVGDVTELADSIREHGIRQNLLAVPDPGDESRFRLVIGHRRHAAAVAAGLTEVPVVVDPHLTDTDQLALMLVENIQRSDLTLTEEADGFQGLLDLGLSVDDVAREVGRSASTVRSRVRITHLSDQARSAVDDGQVTLADVDALAEFEGSPEYAELEAALAKGSQNFKWARDSVNRARRNAATVERLSAALSEAGVTESFSSATARNAAHPNCRYLRNLYNESEAGKVADLVAELREQIEPGALLIAEINSYSGMIWLYQVLPEETAEQSASDLQESQAAAVEARAAEQARKEALKEVAQLAAGARATWIRSGVGRKWSTKHLEALIDGVARISSLAFFEDEVYFTGDIEGEIAQILGWQAANEYVDTQLANDESTDGSTTCNEDDIHQQWAQGVRRNLDELPPVPRLLVLTETQFADGQIAQWDTTTYRSSYLLLLTWYTTLTALGYTPAEAEAAALADLASAADAGDES